MAYMSSGRHTVAIFKEAIMTEQTKVAYVAPTVEKIGDFETTTQHTNSGTTADIALGQGDSILGHLS
ncbi:hypothetical protein AEAC466_21515 [Asticcacaulis sp. AC466]|nr:hypothetical protein AEAC466_21515 [Asticcacaulis sp. AC466]